MRQCHGQATLYIVRKPQRLICQKLVPATSLVSLLGTLKNVNMLSAFSQRADVVSDQVRAPPLARQAGGQQEQNSMDDRHEHEIGTVRC